MDVFECIFGRRSVRSFKEDPIPNEDLKKILEAAIWAPSAGNLQSWEFIVVKDEKRKKALARAALNQMFIAEAPVVIVACANMMRSASVYGERGRRLYCLLDTAAAVQNLMLAAHALGYGTCWIGAFRDEEVMRVLNIPPELRPIAIIPVGVPDEKPRAPPRMPLRDVVHEEEYGRPYPL